MIPFRPWMARLRPESIPITVVCFTWNGYLYTLMEFAN